jgi:hypothetical protein
MSAVLICIARAFGRTTGAVALPANVLLINGQPLLINGQYITIG